MLKVSAEQTQLGGGEAVGAEGSSRDSGSKAWVSEAHISLDRTSLYEKELILKVFSVFLMRPKLPTDDHPESMLSNTPDVSPTLIETS